MKPLWALFKWYVRCIPVPCIACATGQEVLVCSLKISCMLLYGNIRQNCSCGELSSSFVLDLHLA